jgi:chromate reductase
VLGYVSATIVEEACIQLPVRRDQVGSDGTLHDPQLTAAIAATLSALARHVATHVR